MTASRRRYEIARYGLKYNYLPHLLLCCAILLLIPAVSGLNDLDAQEAAVPLETMVSLLGIILLPPVFLPEQDEGIDAVIRSKQAPILEVYCVRLAYLLSTLLLLVGVFVLVMLAQRSAAGPEHYIGTLSSALFLGGIGLLTLALTGNPAASYMTPAIWYMLCFGSGLRLGSLNILSMTMRQGTSKLPQLLLGLALTALAVFLKSRRRG